MQLNITAANARIRDVDVASETANLSRNQVLTQAGTAVLAQANQIPQLKSYGTRVREFLEELQTRSGGNVQRLYSS